VRRGSRSMRENPKLVRWREQGRLPMSLGFQLQGPADLPLHSHPMKLLIDFFPILIFFVTYKVWGIYAATAAIMAATVLQTLWIWKTEKKLQTLHKLTLGLVLVFGALTLFLQDERFIKIKPTLLYTAMAVALWATMAFWRKNPLQVLLGQQLPLPDQVWHRLSWAWVFYCLFMAAINAYVAWQFSTDDWVDFKLWGYVFPLVFLLGQGAYLMKHLPGQDKEAN
jgi:intracellular septation protein